MARIPLPRLGDLIFISILVGCLLLGQRMLNVDADLGRHLTLGRYMLHTGRVPTEDILSFTHAGESRPPYEWLSQVAFALLDGAMGIDGVVLLTAAVIAAAFLVVYVDAIERGGGRLIAMALTIWAAAASSLHWLARPHVFTFLFAAIWLLLLDRLRRGVRGSIWQLPLVMLLWANFHGGFVFGFIAWMAYALGWMLQRTQSESQSGSGRQLLLVGAASLAASVLTPGLGGNWSAVLRNSSPYILSMTAETMPVSLAMPGTWPFVGLMLLALVLGIRCGRRVVAAHGILLVTAAVLAIGIMRNIPLFCIAAVPILALWERSEPKLLRGFRRFEARISAIDAGMRGYFWAPAAIIATAVVLIARDVSGRGDVYGFDARRFPVEAINWVEAHELHGETFSDLNWGGYLLYRMWPERRIFIDSQSDFYGEAFIREYAVLYGKSGDWRSSLNGYGISSVILPPTAPLAVQLMRDPAWTIAYEDSTAVVLVRGEI
jgi:hypothetical protein